MLPPSSLFTLLLLTSCWLTDIIHNISAHRHRDACGLIIYNEVYMQLLYSDDDISIRFFHRFLSKGMNHDKHFKKKTNPAR